MGKKDWMVEKRETQDHLGFGGLFSASRPVTFQSKCPSDSSWSQLLCTLHLHALLPDPALCSTIKAHHCVFFIHSLQHIPTCLKTLILNIVVFPAARTQFDISEETNGKKIKPINL